MADPAHRYSFHVSKSARRKYGLTRDLFSTTGNVVFLDLHAARIFTQRINEMRLKTPVATTAPAPAQEPLRAGDMNAMGLIDEILHYVAGLYRQRVAPGAFAKALAFVEERFGAEKARAALIAFQEEFPPPDAGGDADTRADAEAGAVPEVALEEMLMLSLANENGAFSPFAELFDDAPLEATLYAPVVKAVGEFFRGQPVFGPDDQDLVAMLGSPARRVAHLPGRSTGVHPHPLGPPARGPPPETAHGNGPDARGGEAALRRLYARPPRGLRVRGTGRRGRGFQRGPRLDASCGDGGQERPRLAGPALAGVGTRDAAPGPGARRGAGPPGQVRDSRRCG